MSINPTINADDTITAIVAPAPPTHSQFRRVALRLPIERSQGPYAGRYFLARCGALDHPQNPLPRQEQWSIYLRRALFAASRRLNPTYTNDAGKPTEAIWEFALQPTLEDRGEAWLSTLPEGSPVNLIGPLGKGFVVRSDGGNLLLLAQHHDRLGALLPLCETILDKGGRVTLLIQVQDNTDVEKLRKPLLEQLPIAAELRLAQNEAEWWKQVEELLPWADQISATIALDRTQRLADLIRAKRFRLLPDFAQILVEADLACGVGACLACVVPTASGGLTRACIHGPVLDLTRLAR